MKRRSPRHYARNTALATLGLYAILMLVNAGLVAGAESVRNATPDNDTATTFSNQIGQAPPGLLGVEQSTRRLNAGFFPGNSMRRQTRKFWIVAALAILTNGYFATRPRLRLGRRTGAHHRMQPGDGPRWRATWR